MTWWLEAVGENLLGSMAGIVSLWIGWLIRNEMSSFFLAGELSKMFAGLRLYHPSNVRGRTRFAGRNEVSRKGPAREQLRQNA